MLPSIIEINPTELCNRTCHFCPRGNGYPNQNLNMSLTDARILTDRFKQCNYKGSIHITGHGEPTLNKYLSEIVSMFRETKCWIKTITNGDRLLNGTEDPASYFQQYDEVEISVYEPEQYSAFEELIVPYNNVSLRKSWIEDDYNNRAGWPGYQQPEQHNKQCYYPFYKMYINWNLDVHLCCHDWTDTKIGNLFENSIEFVWNEGIVNKYRKSLSKGRRCDIMSCKNCNVNGMMVGKEMFDEWVSNDSID